MWAVILRHYDTHHKARIAREDAWFGKNNTIEGAITRAALATNDQGKRCDHQRRITRGALQEARAALLERKHAVSAATTFDELLNIVASALRDVYGIGELYRYDTSLHIAAFLRLTPEKVYLHSGTRTGAKALGLPLNKPFLTLTELPFELRSRPAAEIEDILCIYKDQFGAASR